MISRLLNYLLNDSLAVREDAALDIETVLGLCDAHTVEVVILNRDYLSTLISYHLSDTGVFLGNLTVVKDDNVIHLGRVLGVVDANEPVTSLLNRETGLLDVTFLRTTESGTYNLPVRTIL